MKDKQPNDAPDEVAEELSNAETPVWIEADPDLDDPHGHVQNQPAARRRGAGGFFAFLALLLAIASGSGVYYLWEQQKIIQRELVGQPEQRDYDAPLQSVTSAQARLQQQLSQVQENLAGQIQDQESIREKISVLEQQLGMLSTRQAQMQEVQPAVPDAAPAQVAPPVVVDTSSLPEIELANIESLLQLAQDRLTLLHDVRTAIEAMQLADQQLKQLQHPALEPISQSIESDIAALRQVQMPDLLVLAGQIQGLGEQAKKLPLLMARPRDLAAPAAKADRQVTANSQDGWRTILKNITRDLKPLVAIRRTDQVTAPMLDAEDEALVRQLMQVKLQAAGLATLQNNPDVMKYYLQQAADWLAQRYDMDNADVSAMAEKLHALMQVSLAAELPQTGSALQQLRTLIYPGITP